MAISDIYKWSVGVLECWSAGVMEKIITRIQ